MSVDVRLIAFYLPQFHPTPYNDLWWGKGFTEWRNVTKAAPLFEGHYQPHLPSDLGYYDLRLDQARIDQAELARRYGVHGFCYYYYWFNGHRVLDLPLNRLMETHTPDFPFCVCWANENWNRMWDGGNSEVLLTQEHDFASDMDFIRDVIPLFRDDRYIRVGGVPLLLIYRVELLKNPAEIAQGWREECAKAGIPELHLCAVQSFSQSDPRKIGFDSACEFPPHQYRFGDITNTVDVDEPDFKGKIYDYEIVSRHSVYREPPDYPLYRTLFPSWDNTARKRKHALVYHRASPRAYEYWLKGLVDYARKHLSGDQRIVFVNAWNEWAEGAHLEPDIHFGLGYLEATKRVLEGRTDSAVLRELMEAELGNLPSSESRGRMMDYLSELEQEVQELKKTINFFQSDIGLARYHKKIREVANFMKIDPSFLTAKRSESPNNAVLETLNGQRVRTESIVRVKASAQVFGWCYTVGLIPEAETTQRFVALRCVDTNDTYIAVFSDTHARADVVKHNASIDPKFATKSGFSAPVGFFDVPSGQYRVGVGQFGPGRYGLTWMQNIMRVIG